MRIEIIAFTERGYHLSEKLKGKWMESGELPVFSGDMEERGRHERLEIELHAKTKALPEISETRELSELVGDWFGCTAENFKSGDYDDDSNSVSVGNDAASYKYTNVSCRSDVIIFVGSTGIAVRAIAPFLKHKSEDPAVLVIDEAGHFVISLLSGHLGGGNEWAGIAAHLIGAEPVITTATDNEGAFAVDIFAKENGFAITDFGLAKEVSAKVLRGEKLRIYSDIPMDDLVKKPGITEAETVGIKDIDKADVIISYQSKILESPAPAIRPFNAIGLRLTAKRIYVGIGARKGVDFEDVQKAFESCMKSAGISKDAVAALCSIDLKKNEQGILTFSYKNEIPFVTFTASELESQEGAFAASAFVKSVTGVSNVCERAAAYAASRNGRDRVVVHKQIYGSVTLAVAVQE